MEEIKVESQFVEIKKSKYKSLSEWKKNREGAYKAARRLGMIDEICKNFGWDLPSSKNRKPPKFWTLDRCKEEYNKYKSLTEWKNKSRGSYSATHKKGWLEKIAGVKKRLSWDFESCKKEALKYKTRTEWKNKSRGSYESACKHGWLDECNKHMILSKYAKRNV